MNDNVVLGEVRRNALPLKKTQHMFISKLCSPKGGEINPGTLTIYF